MGSMGVVDSGRFSGRKTNFSQTCSLLSRYLKEKGSFGELALCLNPNFESKGTMNLLPMIERSDEKEEIQKKSEAENAQMTIFYAGQVIVFDDFPADKAEEIMVLASNSKATKNHHPATVPPPYTAQIQAESATSFPNIVRSFGGMAPELTHHAPQPPLGSDLPIARKNSLARFLEKRKDRITENAPYQATAIKSAAAAKPPTAEAWLGLGPRQFQHN